VKKLGQAESSKNWPSRLRIGNGRSRHCQTNMQAHPVLQKSDGALLAPGGACAGDLRQTMQMPTATCIGPSNWGKDFNGSSASSVGRSSLKMARQVGQRNTILLHMHVCVRGGGGRGGDRGLRVPTDGPRLSSGLASAMTAAAASRSHSTCTNRAQSLQAMAASSLTLIASPQHRQGYPPHPPTHTHARAHAHDSLRGKRGNPGPWSGPREVSAPSRSEEHTSELQSLDH
jgi:hypothetical protein